MTSYKAKVQRKHVDFKNALQHNAGDADAALAIFFTSSKSSLDATHHGATLGTKSSGKLGHPGALRCFCHLLSVTLYIPQI